MSRPQSSEVEPFLRHVDDPGVSLDDVLKPALQIEAELRDLFAADKPHERLADLHAGLVDVFDAPDAIRATRPRIVKDDHDLSAHYIMPLTEGNRRLEGPCMLDELSDFKTNWDVFTEGSLSLLHNWNNVVAAGGAILACLTPLPEGAKGSRRNMRKHYHASANPSSDVDLFLWGLSLEETEAKIKQIYEAVREAVPWDVTCVRTKNTVSIHSQYPYRSVQIILRQYRSPAEVLAGFDIDAGCCLYDGSRVYASPRAIVAMMRQANTIDETRRSSSYEIRLSKYAARGYEVYYPSLRRDDVDPTIYERSLTRIEGLARLLVLEKLANMDVRYTFLDSRRTLRGRPNPLRRYNKRKRRLEGDLKGDLSLVEMSEYDVVSLHIPYGPGWNARRIDKLVYQTDLSMNSTFNPKNKGRRLHRHPAFFGTVEECMEDCCGTCPEPIDQDEHKTQEEEDQYYIRGRISFIPRNFGRKSVPGSPKIVDEVEWSTQAYIGPTEKLFVAIATCDRQAVSDMLDDGIDLNRRDHVGRTPLHMAILSGAPDIACDLVHAGARITAQMVDGRTSLHLAAQLNQLEVVRTVLERSALNEQASTDEAPPESESSGSRLSSEDDWSSQDDEIDANKLRKTEGIESIKAVAPSAILVHGGDLPEDEDVPDVFDVNGVDWDLNFTPLCHAILFSSSPVVEALLKAGADATFVSVTNDQLAVLPLALTILIPDEDEDRACKIAEKLVSAGASSSAADERGTIFHRAVAANKVKLVSTLLRCDFNATEALNFPTIVDAVDNQNYDMLAILLAHGAKLVISQEDIDRAVRANLNARNGAYYPPAPSSSMVCYPVETALAFQDDTAPLLISLGAEVDFHVRDHAQSSSWAYPVFAGKSSKLKLIEWLHLAIVSLSQDIPLSRPDSPLAEVTTQTGPPPADWPTYLSNLLLSMKPDYNYRWTQPPRWTDESWNQYYESEKKRVEKLKNYLVTVTQLIPGHKKTPQNQPLPSTTPVAFDSRASSPIPATPDAPRQKYHRLTAPYGGFGYGYPPSSDHSPNYLDHLYDDLFEACFTGSNEKIQQMFIPGAAPTAIDTSVFYVSVHVAVPNEHHLGSGITPLVAAIAGRYWDTARLIMTIAGLQYKPVERPARFTTVGIRLDEDDHDHDGSEVTVDEAVAKFVDITKKSVTAQCNVPPDVLLSTHVSWINDKGDKETGSPLAKAVYDDDFEAFVNIANLYKYCPRVNLDADQSLLAMILTKDRPEMLDEWIRRTGHGIAVPATEKPDDGQPAVNDKNRIYTGLSVHGEKRIDLARQNDPNVVRIVEKKTDPLLWQAASAGAVEIVDYLSGGQPLAAYRFYAASNSDARARSLKGVLDLEKVLPEWLGWTVTPLGESPLFAGIESNSLPLIKKLFSKAPRLMASALHERVKGLGVNALMFAIYLSCDTSLVDFLLGQSVSPAVVDEANGYNIFHYICRKGYDELQDHMLHKLPRDVVEALLCQQSKGRLETPVHLAARKGFIRTLTAILAFSPVSLPIRDADGSTALHAAVKCGFPIAIDRLIDAAPAGLGVENGVGHTPREMGFLQELLARTDAYKNPPRERERDKPGQLPRADDRGALFGWYPRADVLARGYWDEPRRQWRPVGPPGLRETLTRLVGEGTLDAQSKLCRELFAFADKLEARYAVVAAAAAEREAQAAVEREAQAAAEREAPAAAVHEAPAAGAEGGEGEPDHAPQPWWPYTDSKDAAHALATVCERVAHHKPARQLVRLAEVQASVEAGLERAGPAAANSGMPLRVFPPVPDDLRDSFVYRKMRIEKGRVPGFGSPTRIWHDYDSN
ncbi:hypothetical protein B0H19DRAFT_1212418 [Mycena capillaripes]|nr:hypothetical protein B0H19DRAFT_1212418 [Mycena capillaripes]